MSIHSAEKARHASHERVEKECPECRDMYWIAKNAYSLSKRCPRCQKTFDRLRDSERKRRKRGPNERAVARPARERCRRCGRPANGYQHYCSQWCYIQDFRVAYCLKEVLHHE